MMRSEGSLHPAVRRALIAIGAGLALVMILLTVPPLRLAMVKVAINATLGDVRVDLGGVDFDGCFLCRDIRLDELAMTTPAGRLSVATVRLQGLNPLLARAEHIAIDGAVYEGEANGDLLRGGFNGDGLRRLRRQGHVILSNSESRLTLMGRPWVVRVDEIALTPGDVIDSRGRLSLKAPGSAAVNLIIDQARIGREIDIRLLSSRPSDPDGDPLNGIAAVLHRNDTGEPLSFIVAPAVDGKLSDSEAARYFDGEFMPGAGGSGAGFDLAIPLPSGLLSGKAQLTPPSDEARAGMVALSLTHPLFSLAFNGQTPVSSGAAGTSGYQGQAAITLDQPRTFQETFLFLLPAPVRLLGPLGSNTPLAISSRFALDGERAELRQGEVVIGERLFDLRAEADWGERTALAATLASRELAEGALTGTRFDVGFAGGRWSGRLDHDGSDPARPLDLALDFTADAGFFTGKVGGQIAGRGPIVTVAADFDLSGPPAQQRADFTIDEGDTRLVSLSLAPADSADADIRLDAAVEPNAFVRARAYDVRLPFPLGLLVADNPLLLVMDINRTRPAPAVARARLSVAGQAIDLAGLDLDPARPTCALSIERIDFAGIISTACGDSAELGLTIEKSPLGGLATLWQERAGGRGIAIDGTIAGAMALASREDRLTVSADLDIDQALVDGVLPGRVIDADGGARIRTVGGVFRLNAGLTSQTLGPIRLSSGLQFDETGQKTRGFASFGDHMRVNYSGDRQSGGSFSASGDFRLPNLTRLATLLGADTDFVRSGDLALQVSVDGDREALTLTAEMQGQKLRIGPVGASRSIEAAFVARRDPKGFTGTLNTAALGLVSAAFELDWGEQLSLLPQRIGFRSDPIDAERLRDLRIRVPEVAEQLDRVSGTAALAGSWDIGTGMIRLSAPDSGILYRLDALKPARILQLRNPDFQFSFSDDFTDFDITASAQLDTIPFDLAARVRDGNVIAADLAVRDRPLADLRLYLDALPIETDLRRHLTRSMRSGMIKTMTVSLACPDQAALLDCVPALPQGATLELADLRAPPFGAIPAWQSAAASLTYRDGEAALSVPQFQSRSGSSRGRATATFIRGQSDVTLAVKGTISAADLRPAIAAFNLPLAMDDGLFEADISATGNIETGALAVSGQASARDLVLDHALAGKITLNAPQIDLSPPVRAAFSAPATARWSGGEVSVRGTLDLRDPAPELDGLSVEGRIDPGHIARLAGIDRLESNGFVALSGTVAIPHGVGRAVNAVLAIDGTDADIRLPGRGLMPTVHKPKGMAFGTRLVSIAEAPDDWRLQVADSRLGDWHQPTLIDARVDAEGRLTGEIKPAAISTEISPAIFPDLSGAEPLDWSLNVAGALDNRGLTARFDSSAELIADSDQPARIAGDIALVLAPDQAPALNGNLTVVSNQAMIPEPAQLDIKTVLGEPVQSIIEARIPLIDLTAGGTGPTPWQQSAPRQSEEEPSTDDATPQEAAPRGLLDAVARLDRILAGDFSRVEMPEGKVSLRVDRLMISPDLHDMMPARADIVLTPRQSRAMIEAIDNEGDQRLSVRLDWDAQGAAPTTRVNLTADDLPLYPLAYVQDRFGTAGRFSSDLTLTGPLGVGISGLDGTIRFEGRDMQMRQMRLVSLLLSRNRQGGDVARRLAEERTVKPLPYLHMRAGFNNGEVFLSPLYLDGGRLFEVFVDAQVKLADGALKGWAAAQPLPDILGRLETMPIIADTTRNLRQIGWQLTGTLSQPEFDSIRIRQGQRLSQRICEIVAATGDRCDPAAGTN